MNSNAAIVITSIASHKNTILKGIASEALKMNTDFYLIGDKKSPEEFYLEGCKYYSVEKQSSLGFGIISKLPFNQYSRKNIGYLLAIKSGAEVIIETDDDNIPSNNFWIDRESTFKTSVIKDTGWVNVYKYYTKDKIWPRGFPLDLLEEDEPTPSQLIYASCPIQQGLVNGDPDVDAIYRLLFPLPFNFREDINIALGNGSVCPFNSQNTTWFPEAYPLLYLPSFCSFRMTDIWRSFIAQRIAWTCGWHILFHSPNMYQERNSHNLMKDFSDEVPGYLGNSNIVKSLISLDLKDGTEYITQNLFLCYEEMVRKEFVSKKELSLLELWIRDIEAIC